MCTPTDGQRRAESCRPAFRRGGSEANTALSRMQQMNPSFRKSCSVGSNITQTKQDICPRIPQRGAGRRKLPSRNSQINNPDQFKRLSNSLSSLNFDEGSQVAREAVVQDSAPTTKTMDAAKPAAPPQRGGRRKLPSRNCVISDDTMLRRQPNSTNRDCVVSSPNPRSSSSRDVTKKNDTPMRRMQSFPKSVDQIDENNDSQGPSSSPSRRLKELVGNNYASRSDAPTMNMQLTSSRRASAPEKASLKQEVDAPRRSSAHTMPLAGAGNSKGIVLVSKKLRPFFLPQEVSSPTITKTATSNAGLHHQQAEPKSTDRPDLDSDAREDEEEQVPVRRRSAPGRSGSGKEPEGDAKKRSSSIPPSLDAAGKREVLPMTRRLMLRQQSLPREAPSGPVNPWILQLHDLKKAAYMMDIRQQKKTEGPRLFATTA